MASGANRTAFCRPRFLNGLELVAASYRKLAFPAHAHPEFVIGAIVSGAERLVVGRQARTLVAGDTLFLHPGEVHANACVGDAPLHYRVFYVPSALLRDTLGAAGVDAPLLSFDSPFGSSPRLYDLIVRSHAALWTADDSLSQECALLELATGVAAASRPAEDQAVGSQHARVRAVLDHLHAHFRDNPSLSILATVAGLSPFHLLRTFKRQTGLSPVAYRNLLRVMAVRAQLWRGASLADAALDAGFADQSHMTRAFKLIMGATPGCYARQ